jgi:hypothetical protein
MVEAEWAAQVPTANNRALDAKHTSVGLAAGLVSLKLFYSLCFDPMAATHTTPP